jgi:hypothetical protein
MKFNTIKLGISLVIFSLMTGIYSQISISQALAQLSIPDCVGIIVQCNDQECSVTASNQNSDDDTISQSNDAFISQSAINEAINSMVNSTGNPMANVTGENNQTASITQSNVVEDNDSVDQTSTASSTCTFNESSLFR